MSKLTAKQEKFVQGLIAGLSQREAYKQVYETKNMKEATIDSRASRLLKERKISARYRELLSEFSNLSMWTRESAFNEYEWLKNKAKDDIKEDGVRQATANAFISSLEGMNQMAFRDLELADKKLLADIKKSEIETGFTKARTEQIKGATKDTSLLETLLKGQQQYEDMTKTGAFDKFGDADE